jgi:hypothetical protein
VLAVLKGVVSEGVHSRYDFGKRTASKASVLHHVMFDMPFVKENSGIRKSPATDQTYLRKGMSSSGDRLVYNKEIRHDISN